MNVIAALGGLVIAFFGAVAVTSPPQLISMMGGFASSRGLWVATAVRLVMGLAFLFAAPTSQAPGFLYVFGVFALLAAVATPFVGVERFQQLLTWWSGHTRAVLRTWGAVVLVLGLAVVWAVLA